MYYTYYQSPLGRLLLAGDDHALTGLWLQGQKYYGANLDQAALEEDGTDVFVTTKIWLDQYFRGSKPSPHVLKLAPIGSDFRQAVWTYLLQIPYGLTTTYRDIAYQITGNHKQARAMARAVGGAVGHNPISLIIPCHRVLGSNGNLTGYAGGLIAKEWLLELEGIKMP